MSARAPSSTTVASIRSLADQVIALAQSATDPGRTVGPAGRTLPQVLTHLTDVVARHAPDGCADDARAGSQRPLAIDLTDPRDPGDPTAPIPSGEVGHRGRQVAPTRRAVRAPDVAGLPLADPQQVTDPRQVTDRQQVTDHQQVTDPCDGSLLEAAAALRAAVARLPAGPALDDAGPVPYTGRVEVVPADLYGLILGEFVAVGHDVATGLHRHWHIDPDDASLVIGAVCNVLPAWVDADCGDRADRARGELEVRVRGNGRYRWRFADGTVTVDPPTPQRRPDVTISGRPDALVLLVYGRLPLWRGLATGRVVAWGRRPRLALAATGCLRAP